MTSKEKKTIEDTKKAIDNLILCFAQHPSFSLETFADAKQSLEDMAEALDIAAEIDGALEF